MNTTLKLSAILLSSVLLIFSNALYAGDHHGAHALQHATLATSHGEQGHNKFVQVHAKEALKHAKMAAQVHYDQHMHMMKAIKLLDSSVKNADKGKTDLATKNANEALAHIHKSLE